MTWMTDNFTMETNMKGGLMKGLGRMLRGNLSSWQRIRQKLLVQN
jgi:uncharacterized protein (AIM24 family)